MIGNSNRRHDEEALLNYAARGGAAACVAGSMPLDSPVPSIVSHFKQILGMRPELRSAKLIHLSMSLAEQDRSLSPTEWGEISQITAERLGINEGPWQAWVHTDGHTLHVHLVASTIRYDGHRIESRDHFKKLRNVARELELNYGLWRVGNHPGEPVLPPISAVPELVGPRFELPEAKLSFRNNVKDSIYEVLRQHPGIRLPELRKRLAVYGVDLVPKFSAAEDKLVGLGFRVGDAFEIASKVDKTFSLAGLKIHHGVAYDPHQDQANLRDSFALPTPGITLPAVLASTAVVDQPTPVAEQPRPILTAPTLTPKQEYRHVLRQIALGVANTVWATLDRIKIEPARQHPRFNTPHLPRPRL